MKWNGNGYAPGLHYVQCDRCGLDVLSDIVRKEWNGAVVCDECWESRHPQEFVRAPNENIAAKELVSPEPTDTFTEVTYGDSGVPGIPTGTFDNEL
jgi:hypothetical protein